LLDGGDGADTALGGEGNDTIWGAISTVTNDLGDHLYGQGGADLIGGSYGDDYIDGGVGDDALYGDEGNDTVLGGDGNDLLRGDWGWGADANGNDYLDGGNGSDTLYGGAGTDTLIGGAGDDYMDGGAGVDTASYVGAPAGVTVNLNLAGAQNTVGAGLDTLVNIENVSGSNFNDVITGNAGDNRLDGNGGDDVLSAGAGNDRADGGAGNDIVRGDAGNDSVVGGLGDDLLDGGAGIDAALYNTIAAAVNVNLATNSATGGQGNDTLVNIENVVGSTLADTLTGNAGDNTLNGAAGNDTMGGGAGNDTLIGDVGNDTMSGQGGSDVFRWTANVFNSADVTFGGIDKITDFNAGDKVDFTAALEAIMKVNGVALGGAASNVALGHAFNANTNVCMNGNDLVLDLDNSHSFTANDFHVQVVGSAGNMTYDAAADTFHI
jgi:Ca2+-binding RTX toxin-like protein